MAGVKYRWKKGTVANENNRTFGTKAGKNTKDKVFLLAERDLFTKRASEYGFRPDGGEDEARTAVMSAYASASGDTSFESCWLTRTPGAGECDQMFVWGDAKYEWDPKGLDDYDTRMCERGNYGIRPAITLELSSNRLWDYAGTVCSDGTENTLTGKIVVVGSTDTILAGKKVRLTSPKGKKLIEGTTVKLSVKIKTTGKTAGKKLNWSSSNKAYAAVSQSGVVTAKKEGVGKTVTITATAADKSGVKAGYKFKIVEDTIQKVELCSLEEKKVDYTGGTLIKVKVTRKSGTVTGEEAAKLLTWSSSNERYATVSKTGEVSARRAGNGHTVTITGQTGKNKVEVTVKIKKWRM